MNGRRRAILTRWTDNKRGTAQSTLCAHQKGQNRAKSHVWLTFFLNGVKRTGRHFSFLKRAGRHQKGAGRRALQLTAHAVAGPAGDWPSINRHRRYRPFSTDQSLVHSTDTCARVDLRESFVWCFSRIKMLSQTETRTRERMHCQSIRTVWDISRDDRGRIATCNLLTSTDRQTDRFNENYSVDNWSPQPISSWCSSMRFTRLKQLLSVFPRHLGLRLVMALVSGCCVST